MRFNSRPPVEGVLAVVPRVILVKFAAALRVKGTGFPNEGSSYSRIGNLSFGMILFYIVYLKLTYVLSYPLGKELKGSTLLGRNVAGHSVFVLDLNRPFLFSVAYYKRIVLRADLNGVLISV